MDAHADADADAEAVLLETKSTSSSLEGSIELEDDEFTADRSTNADGERPAAFPCPSAIIAGSWPAGTNNVFCTSWPARPPWLLVPLFLCDGFLGFLFLVSDESSESS